MIAPGKKLDLDFTVRVLRGGRPVHVCFGDLLHRRTVVSVYMRNNTSVCDVQTASLVQHAAKFRRLACDVIAISRDTCASHAKYAASQGIDFTLVSDPEFSFSRAADAIVQKSMYGKKYQAPARAAYVLDPDGTVRAVIEPVDAPHHADQILTVLAALD